MALYRGPGGSGDATADAANEAAIIAALVTQAQTAASNAASSSSSASTSASNASTSASNAASSASSASSSATNAANSATAAATSASDAQVLADVAANEATASAVSASNAAASYDSFDDRYLGSKSSAPTLDNDGNALLTGALYWNSSNNTMYVWNGTAWASFSSSGTVTSVAMSVPTGLSVSGSPITSSGTLAVTYASGYAIPTTIKQSNWDDSYTFVSAFPTQTGNSGKYLTTNGSALSWATVTLTETDPIVGAINGIVKANGSGTISVAVAGTDYLAPAAIGVTVQAYDAGLQSIAGLTTAADKMIYTTASDTYAVTDLTAAGRAILDDADAAAQRTTLGLGTVATLNSISLTTNVTGTLPVGNGGSGATTLTGVIKGNGTSAFSAATAGTDFVAPGTATTFTAQQTFKEVKDTVHTITDGAAFEIDPANGSIQVVTLGANRTPAATNFEAGQVVLLGIDDGTAYTITWTTVNPTWVKVGGTASAPTLATTGYTWILLWKVGSTVYATEVGKP